MYVCICNRYRDAEICQLARSGVRCAQAAYTSLGNGPRCGRCLALAQSLIDQIHQGIPHPEGCLQPMSVGADRPAVHRGSETRVGKRNQKQESALRPSRFAKVALERSCNATVAAPLVFDE